VSWNYDLCKHQPNWQTKWVHTKHDLKINEFNNPYKPKYWVIGITGMNILGF